MDIYPPLTGRYNYIIKIKENEVYLNNLTAKPNFHRELSIKYYVV